MYTHGRMCSSSCLDSGGNTCTHRRMCASSWLDSGGNTCTHTRKNVFKSLTRLRGNTCTHRRICSSSWLDSGGNTCTNTDECVQVPVSTHAEINAHTRKNVFKFLVRLRRKHMHTHGRMCSSSSLDSGGKTCTHSEECVQVPSLDSQGDTCTHTAECVQSDA